MPLSFSPNMTLINGAVRFHHTLLATWVVRTACDPHTGNFLHSSSLGSHFILFWTSLSNSNLLSLLLSFSAPPYFFFFLKVWVWFLLNNELWKSQFPFGIFSRDTYKESVTFAECLIKPQYKALKFQGPSQDEISENFQGKPIKYLQDTWNFWRKAYTNK